MLPMVLFPDHDGVHDREDAGSPEVVGLDGTIVRKQTDNVWVFLERSRMAGAEECVDLTPCQQIAHSDIVWNPFDDDAVRNLDILAAAAERCVAATIKPFYRAQVDAVLVLQHAANPHGCCLPISHHADAAATEVLGLLNSRVLIDENKSVAKHLRGKHRDRDKRKVAACPRSQVC